MTSLCLVILQSTCTNYILSTALLFLNERLMTPMKIPPLPSESIYWEAFNESECLSIIMRAQNYITDELIRRAFGVHC